MELTLETIRRVEIKGILHWFTPGQKVLEIGGGNGFQAKVLSTYGCQVSSIDLADRPDKKSCYPIIDYDGVNIPFPDACFDIIYTSNVLEHVHNLAHLFTEMRRVLKQGGICIHIIPSVPWRFWTCVSHYGYIIKYLILQRHTIPGVDNAPTIKAAAGKPSALVSLLKKALFPSPHGNSLSLWAEFFAFSQSSWEKVFQAHNFSVEYYGTNGFFYTGFGLFPWISLKNRKRLTAVLGSSCHVFVLRPSTKG